MTQTAQQLSDIGDPTFTLFLGGNPIEVKRLRPKHLAEAVEWLKGERLKSYMKSVPVNAIMNPIHGEALARIQTTSVSDTDVLLDYNGRLFLTWKAIQQAKPGTTLDHVKDMLDVDNAGDFFRIIGRISRILPEESEAQTPDPLGMNGRANTASTLPEAGPTDWDTSPHEPATRSMP